MRVGLNLLYIIPGENGGTQTYAESLVRALAAADAGDEFTAFVSEEGGALALPDRPGFRTVVCPVRASRRAARYAYEQFAFPRLLAAHGLDVLHSLGYVCPLRPPCPSVVTVHDLNYLTPWHGMSRLKRLSLGWFVGQSARHADAVLTVSEFSKAEICRHLGIAAPKITVTLEGPREPAPLSSDAWADLAGHYGVRSPYVMAFGSLSGNKNIARLVRAFAAIQDRVPHSLLLVGHMAPGAALEPGLQAGGAAAGRGDRVRITGYVPDAHVMPLLGHADLFAFPSLYEGFGLPVLEAQAAGVAVACADAASLPEVAGDGAALFDPLSTDDMARVLLDCLLDPVRRSALVEKGRANAARFSWAATAAATSACYRQVIGSRASNG